MMLHSERLMLRPVSIEDARDIFKYRSHKEANSFQGWIPETIEDVEEFISKLPPEINLPDTWFQLVICTIGTQEIIGDIGIHFVGPENQQCEFGITLNPDFQAKGYATEALRVAIDYLFKELRKHRIFVSIDPANLPSVALFERLLFRKEAHMIKSYWTGKEWTDDLIYALLKDEWQSGARTLD